MQLHLQNLARLFDARYLVAHRANRRYGALDDLRIR
jgi:hypothetical protein